MVQETKAPQLPKTEIPLSENEFYNLVQEAVGWANDIGIRHSKRLRRDRYVHLPSIDDSIIAELKKKASAKFPNAPQHALGYIWDNFYSGSYVSYRDWVSEFAWRQREAEREASKKEGGFIKINDVFDLEDRMNQILSMRDAANDPRKVWSFFLPETHEPTYGYAASPYVSARESRKLVFEFHPDMPTIRYVDYLTFNLSLGAGLQPSSGSRVMGEFDYHFRTLERAFTEGRLLEDPYLSQMNVQDTVQLKTIREALRFVPRYVELPANSNIALLTDEPTVHLDPDNQRQITEALFTFPNRQSRMQLFVATNDTELIRAAPKGTIYVVCAKDKPIVSTRKYKV